MTKWVTDGKEIEYLGSNGYDKNTLSEDDSQECMTAPEMDKEGNQKVSEYDYLWE